MYVLVNYNSHTVNLHLWTFYTEPYLNVKKNVFWVYPLELEHEQMDISTDKLNSLAPSTTFENVKNNSPL